MTPVGRKTLRAIIALLAAFLLSAAGGVAFWAASAKGELSYERDLSSVCAVQQGDGSRHMDCVSLNSVVAAPFALTAAIAGLWLAWQPRRWLAAWIVIGAAIGGTIAVTLANVGTPRRDWALGGIAACIALSAFLLARASARDADGAGG